MGILLFQGCCDLKIISLNVTNALRFGSIQLIIAVIENTDMSINKKYIFVFVHCLISYVDLTFERATLVFSPTIYIYEVFARLS